jgi:hypothetical protein
MAVLYQFRRQYEGKQELRSIKYTRGLHIDKLEATKRSFLKSTAAVANATDILLALLYVELKYYFTAS